MSEYKKEFEVKSIIDKTKYKTDETEKKYSAFAMDVEPDSKVNLLIHSDKKIDLKPGDIIKATYIKKQSVLGD